MSSKEDSTCSEDDIDDVGAQPPSLRDRIIVKDVSDDGDDEDDEDDVDDVDVDPPSISMGRGHRARRHNGTMPHTDFLFLQTPFKIKQ